MVKVNILCGFKLIVIVAVVTAPSMQLCARAQARKQQAVHMQKKVTRAPLIKTDYSYTQPYKITSEEDDAEVREVYFTNDLCEIVELDLMCQNPTPGKQEKECLEHFRQIPITIRAEKEYKIKDGDEINVETKRSWELSIQKISNEALLSLKTFRDLALDHFLPKKHIANFMDDWIWSPYNRAKLYIYQKLIARFATTTIIIHTDIDPCYKSIKCSDIILDLDKLASENKLEISIEHENLLNMQVTIKPTTYGSLPHTFF